MEGTGQHASRKVYRAPKLVVYGSVTDLTQGYGSGKPDNPIAAARRKKKSK
jgi:hypothetical protein